MRHDPSLTENVITRPPERAFRMPAEIVRANPVVFTREGAQALSYPAGRR
jgi:hypothetical protein